jgi:D-serine deaminase-like pyridoxal phosphate-dependent protein
MSGKIRISDLDTPAVLLDLDRLEANIKEMSELASAAQVKLRPHVKMHQSPLIAKMQIEAGACGIEVGTVAQAQLMADAGISDIVIAHPFYGVRKYEALKELLARSELKIAAVVDMPEQAEGLSRIAVQAGREIPIYIKIDTGIRRFGVLPGEPVLALADELRRLPGIGIEGVYAHESGAVPTDEGVSKTALETGLIASAAAAMLRREGYEIEEVAVGASPTFRATCRYIREGVLSDITEIHPGAAAVGDIMYFRGRGLAREACALSVLSTVVSTTHSDLVVIDAGYKTLGSDPLIEKQHAPNFYWEGRPSYGDIQGRDDLWLGRMGAESAWLYYKSPDSKRLKLGDRIQIVPNNATLVINLHSKIYGVRKGVVEIEIPITGSGRDYEWTAGNTDIRQ